MGVPVGRDAAVKNGIIRPLWAAVDLDSIRHNVSYLKGLTPPRCMFMAVVKANAYGHGDLQVARAALAAGADCLGVALVEEGARLRSDGLDCPVYLLFEPPPEGAAKAVDLDLICSVYTERFARALSAVAVEQGKSALVHVKVDTGMHRVGVAPGEAADFAAAVEQLAGVEVTGMYTHFAVATEPDDPFTERQMDAFEEAFGGAERALGRRLLKHAANSAGVLAFPRSHYDMVRVGIAMLGLSPSETVPGIQDLEPALTLAGEVAFVKRVAAGEGISYGLSYAPARDSNIATLPVGYADGWSRTLTGKADVLIAGKRRPVAGTICMDITMVDLGDDVVEPGTPFVLIGGDGQEHITAEEVARKLGTINYEVTCMISSRVPRLFTGKKGD
ncbi:MAG: alanine racemase [Candidatus Geothermincolia bacterium]